MYHRLFVLVMATTSSAMSAFTAGHAALRCNSSDALKNGSTSTKQHCSSRGLHEALCPPVSPSDPTEDGVVDLAQYSFIPVVHPKDWAFARQIASPSIYPSGVHEYRGTPSSLAYDVHYMVRKEYRDEPKETITSDVFMRDIPLWFPPLAGVCTRTDPSFWHRDLVQQIVGNFMLDNTQESCHQRVDWLDRFMYDAFGGGRTRPTMTTRVAPVPDLWKDPDIVQHLDALARASEHIERNYRCDAVRIRIEYLLRKTLGDHVGNPYMTVGAWLHKCGVPLYDVTGKRLNEGSKL